MVICRSKRYVGGVKVTKEQGTALQLEEVHAWMLFLGCVQTIVFI
ncbi:hypothetical protein PTUN_a2047 [Pseudoalteromonas tunicata]|nr:hypothetical protein PTUN_a2047 [Pseudoalteromonas tunicata]